MPGKTCGEFPRLTQVTAGEIPEKSRVREKLSSCSGPASVVHVAGWLKNLCLPKGETYAE